MQLPSCSLKVDFLTPMIFRISAAAELALFVLTNRALNSFAVPRLSRRIRRDLGIPSMFKLHWYFASLSTNPERNWEVG
jgi:hypothetical protein